MGKRSYKLTSASRSANHGQIGRHWLAGNSRIPCGRIFIFCFSEPLGFNSEVLNSLLLGKRLFYLNLVWWAVVYFFYSDFALLFSKLAHFVYDWKKIRATHATMYLSKNGWKQQQNKKFQSVSRHLQYLKNNFTFNQNGVLPLIISHSILWLLPSFPLMTTSFKDGR